MGALSTYSKYQLTLEELNLQEDRLTDDNEVWVDICEKTIKRFYDELYDSDIILSEDVTQEYVKVLIRDLNRLIVKINDYKGPKYNIMENAKEKHIRPAIRAATDAHLLFNHFSDHSGFSYKRANEAAKRNEKLEGCREHLNKARKYLEKPNKKRWF